MRPRSLSLIHKNGKGFSYLLAKRKKVAFDGGIAKTNTAYPQTQSLKELPQTVLMSSSAAIYLVSINISRMKYSPPQIMKEHIFLSSANP